jgi:hypothetical protein
MSATPLRNLLLATALIGFSMVALGNGRLDAFVARATADFVMSSSAATAADRDIDAPAYVNTTIYGLWDLDID